ncbi:ABC transporter permease subunit [Anaerocolumna sedimenticola]|uniref:ABC transporter permease subunit n=1 Tax=Anaerocolumna sedimenticola TaxID=2696063 RepID=A0A6P1TL07_9FIRM|nr:sugar ABC transporter permease [Anaerocolumna sedimenticola]QHQ61900.1 ABC transporter permease subunit [Anaerocolumna sedimenticola]
MKKRKIDLAVFFILPGLIGFILFYIWPFLTSLGYAFVDRPIDGKFVGFNNFIDLFHNKPYLMGLKNTFIFIGLCVPLNMILSLAVAIMIKKTFRHKKLFTLVFLIPLVIPSGSMVFFWKMFFDYNGYLNHLLELIGIKHINWLETSLVRFVIVLIFIWKNLGYNIILFISGLSAIPKEYYEAAKVDGAGSVQEFFGITLINLTPTFILVIIMSVINSFKVFKEIYLITGSYPHESIYMLQHFMNNMFNSLDYQKLTTATCVLVFVISLLTQFLFRLEKKVSL